MCIVYSVAHEQFVDAPQRERAQQEATHEKAYEQEEDAFMKKLNEKSAAIERGEVQSVQPATQKTTPEVQSISAPETPVKNSQISANVNPWETFWETLCYTFGKRDF
jgi:hypothetical protein